MWDDQTRSLLWVDIDGRRLHCLHTPSGAQRDWPLPEEPGCLALVHDTTTADPASGSTPSAEFPAAVILALRSGFHRFDLARAALSRLTGPLFDTARYRFNDGTVDPRGRFWAGSLNEGKDGASAGLYCLERGSAGAVTGAGAPASPWRDWGVQTSNGLAFSPDGLTLYHSDTPAHVVYAYDFDVASGAISQRRQWWQAPSDRSAVGYGGRPDGATVDADGCYWTAQYEGGRVLQISPAGQVLREIRLPARSPTMVTFGGSDLGTLYITSAGGAGSAEELRTWPLTGHVFAVPVEARGLAACRYME